MSTATIRRGSPRRGKPPVKRRGGTRPVKRPAATSRALITIPLPASVVRRLLRQALALLLVGGAIAMVLILHVPQMIGTELGEAAGLAGFTVKSVEIQGVRHMERLPIYQATLDQQSIAMPLVDLEAIRERLLKFGWVEDARVSRRLPDTLVVDIVERAPAAIWQHDGGKLTLIDQSGIPLAPVPIDKMPDLPLVIGPDANRQTPDLARLVAAAPSLKPMMAGATWVGGRRWNLQFQSNEILMLPEGEAAAQQAIRKFAEMDARSRLLGRGYVHFDMRLPDKMFVRTSREPGRQIQPNVPVKQI